MRRLLASSCFLLTLNAHAGGSASEFGSAFYTGLSISVVQVRLTKKMQQVMPG